MVHRLGTIVCLGIFAITLIFANGYLTYAQSQPPTTSAYKIGIVDVQKVMDNYNKRAVEVKKLEAEVEKKKTEIEKLRETFQNELKQFQEDRATMSDEERADREAELDNRALAVESAIRQAEAAIDRQHRRLKNELIKDIIAAVTAIGTEENYHLILESDPERRTGVLFYSTTIDMTPKVIDRLNKGS